MRVITGTARGRNLLTLSGEDVRPTLSHVKEAIFSAIQFSVPGSSVLDLFAGSGQMGIEALSRGAAKAVFTDVRKESCDTVKANLKLCRLEENATVVMTEAVRYIERNEEKFDFIFFDPPYREGYYEKLLDLISKNLTEDGKVICEHPDTVKLAETYNGLKLKKTYRFSHVAVSIYEKSEVSE